ncbi:MAG: mechanosensitive ion channel [Actinomycetota bacterium]|nr:mechanosensitive ion channel [Actinomycetota bacterium]
MELSESMQAGLDWFTGAPLNITIIILLTIFISRLGQRSITRLLNRVASADLIPGPKRSGTRQKERAKTTSTVLKSTLNGSIWLIAIFMILAEFGLNLGPLIASAGVIGVALGLGAQTLVRDILSGIFMLVEDQYGVGDKVNVLEVQGVVETVGLRITTVRDAKGTIWYLRNGEILKVGNKSQPRR